MAPLSRLLLEPLRRAIAALPTEIGLVYRLHLDGLDYASIAKQLESASRRPMARSGDEGTR